MRFDRLALSALLLCGPLALGTACEREAPDAKPESVVAEFIERMQRVHGNPKSARAAYELLWSDSKLNLAERAKRASALSGRKVAPEEMLTPSRFSIEIRPRHMSARVEGDWAVVTVTGESQDARAEVKCVREDGSWRVVLEMPPVSPIQMRDDAGI
jgi:hypothetical protein